MRNKRFTGLFFLVLLGAFSISAIPDTHGSRNIVITYDRSSSMFTLKGRQQYFLSAGEFRALGEMVVHLIFQGDPYKETRFSSKRGGRFLEQPQYRDPGTWGALWEQGAGIIYAEYAQTVDIRFDSRGRQMGKGALRDELLRLMPYPKGVPDDAQTYSPQNHKAFREAFPGRVTLPLYGELIALKAFDKMVEAGQKEPEVIWIDVSDRDMDTTLNDYYKQIADRLEREKFELLNRHKEEGSLRTKIYQDSVYQTRAGGRVWLGVQVISYFDKNEWLKRQLAALEEKLRSQLGGKLGLMVNGKRIQGKTVKESLRFKRMRNPAEGTSKLPGTHCYYFGSLQFFPEDKRSERDFKILKALFEVRNRSSDPLKGCTFEIEPKPTVGNPMRIRVPENARLVTEGKKAKLLVKYEVSSGSGRGTTIHDWEWSFEDVYFPSPGFLERRWWLFMLIPLGVIVVGFVFVRTRSKLSAQRGQGPVISKGKIILAPLKRLFGNPAPVVETPRGKDLKAAVKAQAKGFPDMPFEEGRDVVLAPEDRLPGYVLWDLGAPGNRLVLRDADILHNDRTISGGVVDVTSRSGEKISIRFIFS